MAASSPSTPQVLHCDNHVLVTVKPACMPVVPDDSGDYSLLEWAKDWVAREYSKPGAVFLGVIHRLDRPVSGLVTFGRTSKGAARLSAAWREGAVQKIYLAESEVQTELAVGSGGVVAHWLYKDRQRNLVQAIAAPSTAKPFPGPPEPPPRAHARWAQTHWRIESRTTRGTGLWLQPLTGRPHQLRVACASLGLVLRGDLKYGANQPMAGRRIALHAAQLSFPHPTTKERLEFHAPAPFAAAW